MDTVAAFLDKVVSHSANNLGKVMHPIYLSSALGQLLGQQGSLTLVCQPVLKKNWISV